MVRKIHLGYVISYIKHGIEILELWSLCVSQTFWIIRHDGFTVSDEIVLNTDRGWTNRELLEKVDKGIQRKVIPTGNKGFPSSPFSVPEPSREAFAWPEIPLPVKVSGPGALKPPLVPNALFSYH